MIITIDGTVGTGKSTVATKLARALGYIYFDTGAMYRALTWGIMQNKIDIHNEEQLNAYLDLFDYKVKIKQGEKSYCVANQDVSLAIRGQEVTSKVSEVSAIPKVREKLVALQRQLSLGVNAVFEGRDIGTVVFPNANLKIFLTADPKVRAKRRYDELCAKFPDTASKLTFDQVLEEINQRDHHDSTRELSPLKQANDAFLIDTSQLSIDEVVLKILELKDRLKVKV